MRGPNDRGDPNPDTDEIPDVDVSSNRLTAGDESFEFDHEIEDYVSMTDRVLLLFDVWRGHDKYTSQPILPDENRNVSCFGYDGKRLWQIEDPPHEFPAEEYARDDVEGDQKEYREGKYYKYFLEIGNGIFVRHTNKYRYEIDPVTGTLSGAVVDNLLTIGGRKHSFPAPIKEVIEIDGKTVVLLAYWWNERLSYTPDDELDNEEQVYCFDEGGDLLWCRSGSYVDVITRSDGLWLIQHYQSGNKHNVDIETGRIERSLSLREPF